MPWLCPSLVKFAIQNVVLRVSKRKTPRFFPAGPFSWLFDKMFIEVPQFHETSPALKNFWLPTCAAPLNSCLKTAVSDDLISCKIFVAIWKKSKCTLALKELEKRYEADHFSMVFQVNDLTLFRSSQQKCSIEIGVLKNFTKFTRKHLCQSFFLNKVAGLRSVKFLRTPFLQNTSGRLHLFVLV